MKPKTALSRSRTRPGGHFVQCNLSLPPALVKRLDAAARAQRRNRSNFVTVMLERELNLP